jgi:mRNA interferase MazF
MVMKGSIVLVNFPFTDLSQTKLRPAIILWIDTAGTDVVVCAITSQKTDRLNDGEFLINVTDSDFSQTGLRVSSKVRTTRIATLSRQLVVRELGKLGAQQHRERNTKMTQAFQLS